MATESTAGPPAHAQTGIVKSVTSGDTLVIRGKPVNGPPPERVLSLAYITAPRLARRPRAGGAAASSSKAANGDDEAEEAGSHDEPYAWASREFMRRALVNQQVRFVVDYKAPSGREFGLVWMGGKNAARELVLAGLARVRAQRERREPSAEYAELARAEGDAQAAERGLWAKEKAAGAVRDIKWDVENPRALLEEYAKKPVDAIVEFVRDAGTFRVLLLTSPMQQASVCLTGIKVAAIKRDAAGKDAPEPFAEEAKFFVESRLLQRNVQVLLEGQLGNSLFGTLVHPAGNISEALLREGYAKCATASMGLLTSGREAYRAAEKEAKDRRLRLWRDYVPTAAVATEEKTFKGKVVEVPNGECVVVSTDRGERRITLASIRQPRRAKEETAAEGGDAGPAGRRNVVFATPYLFEAREFLRKKLIDKTVQVDVEYIKAAGPNFPEQTCASVTLDGVDMGEALVSKGLATAVRHREGDEQRSSRYDELLAAQARAEKAHKGLHSKTPPKPMNVNDTTADAAKAKQLLPFLQRAGRSAAVVEGVISGSRLRVYIPKDTCVLTLLLGMAVCPRAARRERGAVVQAGQPFGDEALAFTRARCLHRDVEIEIDSVDKASAFVGTLYVNGVNLAQALIEEGLATVHWSADGSVHERELYSAQERAKAAKKGLWASYDEEAEKAKREAEAAAAAADATADRKVNYRELLICEVLSPASFTAHTREAHKAVEELSAELNAAFAGHAPLPGALTAKAGLLCAAKYGTDGKWYRAKVLSVDGGEARVQYVDFGNSETLPVDQLAALPPTLASQPAQAAEYHLACVAAPADPYWVKEGIAQLRALGDGVYLANVEYTGADGVPCVTLVSDEQAHDDVGLALVRTGLVRAERRREKRLGALLKAYQDAEQEAREAHAGLWEYGDPTEDDAREFGFKAAAKRK